MEIIADSIMPIKPMITKKAKRKKASTASFVISPHKIKANEAATKDKDIPSPIKKDTKGFLIILMTSPKNIKKARGITIKKRQSWIAKKILAKISKNPSELKPKLVPCQIVVKNREAKIIIFKKTISSFVFLFHNLFHETAVQDKI